MSRLRDASQLGLNLSISGLMRIIIGHIATGVYS